MVNKLRLIRIIEYYDVPQLFIAEDDNGVCYLCQLYDVEVFLNLNENKRNN